MGCVWRGLQYVPQMVFEGLWERPNGSGGGGSECTCECRADGPGGGGAVVGTLAYNCHV